MTSAPLPGVRILLSSTPSDAHTWNLVFLQLFCEELGHHVANLGPCVPTDMLLERWHRDEPDIIVISTVNGHGVADGLDIATAARRCTGMHRAPMVIGGMLGISGGGGTTAGAGTAARQRLLSAGYARVFDDGDLAGLTSFLSAMRAREAS